MSVTDPDKSFPGKGLRQRTAPSESLLGPRGAFLAAVAVIALTIGGGVIPNDLLMPAVSTLLFVLAAIFALVAWIRCSTDEYRVTYWDVAGAVALVGTCTAALIEPDQMLRIIAASNDH